jgi:hypothetical protein
MKVIFLDFDGVLNNMGTVFKKIKFEGFTGIDPTNVEHFNALMDQTDAKIVVSSTWRMGRSQERLQEILVENGVKGEVVGRTKCLWSGVRGMEILQWMEHGPVDGFAIIDDSEDMAHLATHLVRTSWACGFQQLHISKVLETLNTQWKFRNGHD